MDTKKTAAELAADLDLIQADSLLELICRRLDENLSVERVDFDQMLPVARQAQV